MAQAHPHPSLDLWPPFFQVFWIPLFIIGMQVT